MTKKDYIAIAELFRIDLRALSSAPVRSGYLLAIGAFTRYAAAQNPKFNAEKFESAIFDK